MFQLHVLFFCLINTPRYNIILSFHTHIYDISFQIVFEGILAYNHVYNEIAIDDIRLSQSFCGNFLLFGSFGFL
jgi:hypothetical protein